MAYDEDDGDDEEWVVVLFIFNVTTNS